MSSLVYHDSDSSCNSSPLVFDIISKNGREYGVEYFNGKYFLVSLIGSDLPAKQVARTELAINAAIEAFEEELTCCRCSEPASTFRDNEHRCLPCDAAVRQWEHSEYNPNRKIEVVEVREVVHVYAVATRTDDHLIRIAAPAEEITPSTENTMQPSTRTAHQARNELRALFTQVMSNDEYKTRRAELLEEIKALEAAEQAAHVGAGTISYLYHNLSLEDALTDFRNRFKCSPTHIYISKYDSAPAVEGAIIERRGAVLPGSIWMGAR